MNITISAERTSLNLAKIIILLSLAQAVCLIGFYLGHDYLKGFIPLFYFDLDTSIPAYFSTVILLTSAVILYYIYLVQVQFKKSWLALSLIFVFLSMDEAISIHERFMEPVKASLNTSGYLLYAWVIPYGIAVTVFVVAYFKFLMHLPKTTMIQLIVAGGLFVSGALGMELIGGKIMDSNGGVNFTYRLVTTVEELLEMTGISYFIYSLLSYIVSIKVSKETSLEFTN